jgi:hypothetical protein
MTRDASDRQQRRHQIVLAILPALVLACAYVLAMRVSSTGRIERAREELAATQRTMPSADVLDQALDKASALRAEVAREKALRARTAPVAAEGTDDVTPIWQRGLAELFTRHRVVVVADRAHVLDRVGGAAPSAAPGRRLPARTLELLATYADFLAALTEIGGQTPPSRIVEMTMKKNPNDPKVRVWTLTIG